MNQMISAVSLEKKFGDLVAVNKVDFTIFNGETFGFLGPNGAGKTTIMKMIYCAVKPMAIEIINPYSRKRSNQS